MKRFLLLNALLPGLALAALLAGFHLNAPALMSGGVLILGLRFLVAGALALRDRRIPVWNPNYRRFDEAIREYRGVATVPMGLAGVLLGACLVALALAHLTGVPLETVRDTLLVRPVLGLAPAGTMLLLYGLGFLMGFRDDGEILSGSTLQRAVIGVPWRLGGLILCLLGAGLLGMGAWDALDPGWLCGLLGRELCFGSEDCC